ncbi:MAG: nucleotidyltransferase family protein [Thermoprotei archaeon]|nr:nucleotidyltransferase family protein [Thermoprotei archaeon]
MKAVILAGGLGKRLRPITNSMPKPLIPICGKPIIVWQIEWLKDHGVNEFVICAGYLREKIIEALGNGSKLGVKIGYVVEENPLGTGGAVKNAELFLRGEEGFFVINGDILTNLNPLKLVKSMDGEVVGAIAITPLRSPYGIVSFDSKGYIKSFTEKPMLREYWINAGVYYFRPKIFEYLPSRGDIETTALPLLAERGLLKAVKYVDIMWKSIDTHKDLDEAEKLLKEYSIKVEG